MDGCGSQILFHRLDPLHPPLKWAGGKRWFIPRFSHLFPKDFDRYVEPFVGSGAVFFSVGARKALISDANSELMHFYEVLKTDYSQLERAMAHHSNLHGHDYYYQVRADMPSEAVARAARFLYLNRTCWNGLYRVNKKGDFNVPIGTKDSVVLRSDDFAGWSRRLQNAEIQSVDFRESLARAGAGDFVFVDPPYTIEGAKAFVKYNSSVFSWSDQEDLASYVRLAAGRGAKVLLTNARAPEINKLYKGFKISNVQRAGIIAGDSFSRGKYDEVVVQCWKA